MLRDLLVHISSERPVRPVLDAAVSLAVTHAAHLDAVSIGFEYTDVDLAPDGGAEAEALFEAEHDGALARANAALAVFETEARNASISYGLRPLAGAPAEATAAVSALARLHDLTITLQPEPGGDTFDNAVAQEDVCFNRAARFFLFPIRTMPDLSRGISASHGMAAAWRRAPCATRRRSSPGARPSLSSPSMRRKYPPNCPRRFWCPNWQGAGSPRISSASALTARIFSRPSCRLRPTSASI